MRLWRDARRGLTGAMNEANFVACERRRGRERRKCGRYVAGSRMSLDRTLSLILACGVLAFLEAASAECALTA